MSDKRSDHDLLIEMGVDIKYLKEGMDNHLKWHEKEGAKMFGYAGFASGVIATTVTIILQFIRW